MDSYGHNLNQNLTLKLITSVLKITLVKIYFNKSAGITLLKLREIKFDIIYIHVYILLTVTQANNTDQFS